MHSFPTRRSSDLHSVIVIKPLHQPRHPSEARLNPHHLQLGELFGQSVHYPIGAVQGVKIRKSERVRSNKTVRSEEHTSELQSREISYAVFCLKKKKTSIGCPPSVKMRGTNNGSLYLGGNPAF